MNLKIFKRWWIVLLLIVILGIFLRNINFKETFIFAHDGDLSAWIVKDIVFDKHIRLIGQETSAPGVFIGPLYYYALIPFYFLSGWEAIGGVYLALIIGALTIVSYYYVFNKVFDRTTGLIAAFVQAVLTFNVSYDRWVVPTITTNLWVIWFFYGVMMILKGNYNFLILLGVLAGLVWHINFSLAPLFTLVLIAAYLSKKLPDKKQIFFGILSFFITSVPFWLFELRHGFSQVKTILGFITVSEKQYELGFLNKLYLIFLKVSGNLTSLFFYPLRYEGFAKYTLFLGILVLGYVLVKRKVINLRILTIFYSWIVVMFLTFSILAKAISEYYFDNINVIFLSIFILTLSYIYKNLKFGSFALLVIFITMTFRTYSFFSEKTDYDSKGYLERKNVVNYIKNDSISRGYPCISVSYITNPGDNVGFRYLFFLNNLHVNEPKSESPNYTIVIPPGLSTDSVRYISGAFGVIPPDKDYSKEHIAKSCSGQNSNLTESMLGFTY